MLLALGQAVAEQTLKLRSAQEAKPSEAPSPAAVQLLQVQANVGEKGATVLLTLSQSTPYHDFVLSDPVRLCLDLEGAQLGPGLTTSVEVGSPWLERIRIGQHKEPLCVRVVLDLPQTLPYRIEPFAEGKQILMHVGEGASLAMIRFQGVEPLAEPTPPPQADSWVPKSPSPPSEARYRINTDAPAEYRTFFLRDPPRVVVDLMNTRLEEKPQPQEFPEGPVERIRVGQFDPTTTRVVFDLRELTGYRLERAEGSPPGLWVTFTPTPLLPLGQRVVVVDPGHGGSDPGTLGIAPGIFEKAITLDVAQRLVRLLRQHGLTAMLTRSEDVYVSLEERVQFANQGKAHLFVSIHCNAFPQRGARRGVETYYWTPQSATLAEAVHQEYLKAVGFPDGGIRNNRRFFVIRHTQMPSILVEIGYLDHMEEGKLLSDPDFRQRAAQGLCNGILRYLGRPPRLAQGDEERRP